MWDDWQAIERTQAQADREAAERSARPEPLERPRTPGKVLKATPTPLRLVESVPEPSVAWDRPPRPEPPVVDDARGLRLLAKLMRERLEKR